MLFTKDVANNLRAVKYYLGPLPSPYCGTYTAAAAAVASVVSDSVRPHRQQPTRLPRPWDSPGKNTGVGCHFLLQCMKVESESEVTQSCPTLCDPMDCMQPTRLLRPWAFPSKSTGVGCHRLLRDLHYILLLVKDRCL